MDAPPMAQSAGAGDEGAVSDSENRVCKAGSLQETENIAR
jgi:hypothetical protein